LISNNPRFMSPSRVVFTASNNNIELTFNRITDPNIEQERTQKGPWQRGIASYERCGHRDACRQKKPLWRSLAASQVVDRAGHK
jgi:hypothetical protein